MIAKVIAALTKLKPTWGDNNISLGSKVKFMPSLVNLDSSAREKNEVCLRSGLSWFKVVICGKYKNLNKITKIKHISLKFNRLLIFVILYSLQCKIEGHAVLKSVLIWKDQREILCSKI